MLNFDELVRSRAPPEVYESYHDIANKHMRHELSVKQFRGHLESLFKHYHEILSILPNFFSESGDMNINNANRFKIKKAKSVGQHFASRMRDKSLESSEDENYEVKLAQSVS